MGKKKTTNFKKMDEYNTRTGALKQANVKVQSIVTELQDVGSDRDRYEGKQGGKTEQLSKHD